MAPQTSRQKTARYRRDADPATGADYLARKKGSYKRRKQLGKIPYVKSDELSEREKKKQRDKWKTASRGYRERKKIEVATLDPTPPSTEKTPPVLAGVGVVKEQQENPGQAVVDPLPLNEDSKNTKPAEPYQMGPLTGRQKTARYMQRINADPAARADYLARKKESYKRRKQLGKIPYVKSDELSEREKKKLREKWKAASRGYRERKKMEMATLDPTPPSTEKTPPVLAGVGVVKEQQENPGQAVVDPLPLNEDSKNTNLDDLSAVPSLPGFTNVTCSKSEKSHGEGAPDGIGGAITKEGDPQTPQDLNEMPNKRSGSSITHYWVSRESFENVEELIPGSLEAVKGTFKIHQVLSSQPAQITQREVSCFCKQDKDVNPAIKEMETMILECAKLDREINCFVDIVQQVISQVSTQPPEAMFNLSATVREQFNERIAGLSDDELQSHQKVMAFKQSTKSSLKQDKSAESMEELDEDIAVSQQHISFTCPITKVEMVNPVKNKNCNHRYDEEAILGLIRTRHNQKKKCCCPVVGCGNTNMKQSDLIPDQVLKRQIQMNKRHGNQA